MADEGGYAARFDVDYPGPMNRLTTFFRIIWAIPILILLGLITNAGVTQYTDAAGNMVQTGGGISVGLFIATVLMLVVRRKYPRWWFDFALELGRFSARVSAYLFLLTDKYPSTDETQSVHLDVDYPDAMALNRWLPLVKWLLAIPHYIILVVLAVLAFFATIIAWFAILFTGNYPRGLFDFVVGVGRWAARVWAYAYLLVTDVYPPFSLK
ncbi:DUF4389 domain-containing protein [Devosia sp. ZB163]|uniref:DUF4389 domain-containing protein n=1 Tax=Devosia sp. ZB163 TaxID=3025938 RepID=UPI0023621A72|nr:DUF4389 domain-containing protein [Devosia sp. ZB163]MDC9822811.1 DUF4389 domain-containing protein [Devosia sp. ZB163]